MGQLTYTESPYSTAGRVGGFYETIEKVEMAAENLSFDTYCPPKSKRGYYLVPAPQKEESQASRPSSRP